MKKIIRTIIVDLNIEKINTLKEQLGQCKGILVVGKADSITDAILEIQKNKPDLVFINVPKEIKNNITTSYDELDKLKETNVNFKTIVISELPQEIVAITNIQPFDYLPHTYSLNRLQQAIDKYSSFIDMEFSSPSFDKNRERKIALNTIGGIIVVVKRSDIIYAKAEDVYTGFVTIEKSKPTMILKNLKQFEELLNDSTFLRVSRSHLVNLEHIQSYSKGEQEITMTNGEKISLGKDGKEPLFNFFNSLT